MAKQLVHGDGGTRLYFCAKLAGSTSFGGLILRSIVTDDEPYTFFKDTTFADLFMSGADDGKASLRFIIQAYSCLLLENYVCKYLDTGIGYIAPDDR